MKYLLNLCLALAQFSTTTQNEAAQADHMFASQGEETPRLTGSHSLVYSGEKDISAYNNHAYIARYDGRFFVLWSCGLVGGSRTGQHVRHSTSSDGSTWVPYKELMPRPSDSYYIARGFWIREGTLLALVTRCTGENRETEVEALEAYRWDADREEWVFLSVVVDECTINYPPISLSSKEWLVPYRFKSKKQVDGVLIGGVDSVDSWQRVAFPGAPLTHFTESNAIVRDDGSIAVHFRDNDGSGYLYRSVSEDGGRSFSTPVRTDFPDCKAKHYCLRLSSGLYILINNPHTRKILQVAGSENGKVFTKVAILRNEPVAVRNPGDDKNNSPYTYPHAIEHAGMVYFVYSVNRDDIWVTQVSLDEIQTRLDGPR